MLVIANTSNIGCKSLLCCKPAWICTHDPKDYSVLTAGERTFYGHTDFHNQLCIIWEIQTQLIKIVVSTV